MQTETVECPYCGGHSYEPWAEELGFKLVRCSSCRLLYMNPMPTRSAITSGVQTGQHDLGGRLLNVRARRLASRVAKYRRDLVSLFADRFAAGPVRWLDVGAGYGEVVEAVAAIAPAGSDVRGVEPMQHKAADSAGRGLTVRHGFLAASDGPADVVSLVDVLSHLPDFADMLAGMRAALAPGGEIFVETGNLADIERRQDFPHELGLPDHLQFCGEQHLLGWLDRAGFEVVQLRRVRHDGMVNLAKQAAKLAMGRPARLAIPYRSAYRQLQVRARMR